MKSAKDTFLMTMSARLAVVNPARTVAVRGAVRTAVMAEDAELLMTQGEPMDCFVLRWLDEAVDRSEPLPLHVLPCEVRYATRGTGELAGIDRGRVLAALDSELGQMMLPRSTTLQGFTTSPTTTLTTRVWWSEMEPSAVVVDGDALRRQVRLTVFAVEEVA